MNIRRKTYDLCKSIFSSPLRGRIKEIVDDISTFKEKKKNNIQRRILGEMAKMQNSQLLGFLILNRDKDKLISGLPFIKQDDIFLSDSEKNLIEIAHLQILKLNQKCIKNIINVDKYCFPSIYPYHKYNYEINEINEFNDSDALFDPDLANEVGEIFQTHPAIEKAIYYGEKMRQILKEDKLPTEKQIFNRVSNLELSLRSIGPLNFPKILSNNIINLSPDSIEKNSLDYFFSLVCIQASLNNLNELIFNAILTNNLPVFDENNIIKIYGLKGHFGGQGLKLKILPNKKSGYGNLGLCLVKMPIFDKNVDLCYSEKVNINNS